MLPLLAAQNVPWNWTLKLGLALTQDVLNVCQHFILICWWKSLDELPGWKESNILNVSCVAKLGGPHYTLWLHGRPPEESQYRPDYALLRHFYHRGHLPRLHPHAPWPGPQPHQEGNVHRSEWWPATCGFLPKWTTLTAKKLAHCVNEVFLSSLSNILYTIMCLTGWWTWPNHDAILWCSKLVYLWNVVNRSFWSISQLSQCFFCPLSHLKKD